MCPKRTDHSGCLSETPTYFQRLTWCQDDYPEWNKLAALLLGGEERDKASLVNDILSGFISNIKSPADILATNLVYSSPPNGFHPTRDLVTADDPLSEVEIKRLVSQAVFSEGNFLGDLETKYQPYTTKCSDAGASACVKVMQLRNPRVKDKPLISKYFDMTLFDDTVEPVDVVKSILSSLNPVSAFLFPTFISKSGVPYNAWFPALAKQTSCLVAWFDYCYTTALCASAIVLVRHPESLKKIQGMIRKKQDLLTLFVKTAIFKQFTQVVNVVLDNGDTVLHTYFKEGKFALAKCFIEQANNVGFDINFAVEDAKKQTITACARACDAPAEILSLLTGNPRSSSP
jgi:hypothetical protein